MSDKKEQEFLGKKILQNCRNELYLDFPYLDGAFAGLEYEADEQYHVNSDRWGEDLFQSGFSFEKIRRGSGDCEAWISPYVTALPVSSYFYETG